MTIEPKMDRRNGRSSSLRKVMPFLILGLICIVAAVLVFTHPWQGDSEEQIDWDLTLIGVNGDNFAVGFNDIRDMESTTGRGGFFTTAGVVYGPYSVKGVSIEALCDLVGGMGPADILFVSATDGYSSVFDYDQVSGELPTYDPVTMREVPNDGLHLILIYEQDGKPLTHDDGKPLRLAVVGDSDLLTEGFYWVKWVDKIQIITPA